MSEVEERVYIRQAADLLNRRMDTLRRWDRLYLPRNLRSKREKNGRKWRYWTPEQIKGIFDWIERTDRRPGKGLPHWNPSQQEIDSMIENMRRPHVPVRSDE
jgi:hypothetical protein